jgi:hypothetical protein
MNSIRHDDSGNLVVDCETVIYTNCDKMIWTKGFLEVDGSDLNATFRLRSIGPTHPNIFFSVDCFDESYNHIPNYIGDVILSNVIRVCSVTDSSLILSEYTEDVLKILNEKQNDGGLCLTFYFSDIVNRLPDYYIYNPNNVIIQGSIANEQRHSCEYENLFSMKGNILKLNSGIVLPEYVITNLNSGKCNVRLHRHCGAYVYPIGNKIASNQWKTYHAKFGMKGMLREFINKPVDGNCTSVRIGTKYIKVGFQPDISQMGHDIELLIGDFKLYKLI